MKDGNFRHPFWVLALLALAAAARAQVFYWNPGPLSVSDGETQKSYNWTANADGSGARPASLLDDDFSSASTVGSTLTGSSAAGSIWTNVDSVGDTASAITVSGGKLTLKGHGGDVWNSKNQYVGTFRKDITGNFDVTVKVESQTVADQWSKAGIIMFNDYANPTAGGAFLVAVTPGHGFVVHWDSTGDVGRVDSPGGGVDSNLLAFPCWLRAVRVGSKFTGYYRIKTTDQWKQIKSVYTPQGTTDNVSSQIGLFVTAHTNTSTKVSTTAVFDDFTGGGDLTGAAAAYSFNGTGARHNVNARLGSSLTADSVDFTNYGGLFSFQSFTLSVKGAAKFVGAAGMNIDPGTGKLALTPAPASFTQMLVAPIGDTLPPIAKSGAGTTQVKTNPVIAGALSVSDGDFFLNGKTCEFAGFSATGGMLTGLQADDTLILTGDADFSALSGFNNLGYVQIRAEGSGGKVVAFTPGNKTLPNLCLSTRPLGAGGVTLRVGGSTVNVGGNLILRNAKNSAGDGTVDLAAANPAISVTGSVSREESGVTGNSMILKMGTGTWTVKGNADFALAGGSAGGSTLVLDGSSAQTLTLTSGELNNVSHSGTGTLTLGAPLTAASIAQSAGSFDLNGKNVSVNGNLTVTGGGPSTFLNLGGRTLVVKGDASFSGQSGNLLGLNPASGWTIDVTGNLTADFAAVANSTASGTLGKPSANCVNGGGNVNWDFPLPLPDPPVILRDPSELSVKTGQKAVFSVSVKGAKPLVFEWRRQGDTTVWGNDSVLTIAAAPIDINGSLFYCSVSNKDGKDTSNFAQLTVKATCDSVFTVTADTTVAEGTMAHLHGEAMCASSTEWAVESGPSFPITDNLSPDLDFKAPRITGDTVIVVSFTAYYASAPAVKRIRVTVKDVIPNPKFTLASALAWDGKSPLAIRPSLSNKADLAKFPDKALRYSWTLSALLADTVMAGDSLVLTHSREDGVLTVHLCVDNGDTPDCEQTAVTIQTPVSILALRGGDGRVGLLGGFLVWRAPALVRAHGWDGRLLWEARGNPGASLALPPALARALERRRAWLSVSP